VLFAALYVLVLLIDPVGPLPRPALICALAYLGMAALLAAVAWTDWWRDAQIGGLAHAADMAMFATLVFLTGSDTSPFFNFFVFVLLSAAIRWGWRATALTAVLLTLLYLGASLLAATPGTPFVFDNFVVRIGNLTILSLILIWFGVNQQRAHLGTAGSLAFPDPSAPPLPLEGALRETMALAKAGRGAIAWMRPNKRNAIAVVRDQDEERVLTPPAPAVDRSRPAAPFVYQWHANRAMLRDSDRNLKALQATRLIDPREAELLGLTEGVGVPIVSESGEGCLYLERIDGLSSDMLEMAPQLASATDRYLRRRALMRAAEDSAESRSRLAIARDLHDSVVQFLAGAAFRLEGMKRGEHAGRDLASELDELKQLMLQEQGELRTFIAALRSESQIAFDQLATDLEALTARLSRQWGVQASFTAGNATMQVPSRLHLDAQQLVREAVANAVRHAGARTVSIRLDGHDDVLVLDFINDGSAYPKAGRDGRMPLTLRERVEAAGGKIDISRGMGVTKVAVQLPAGGRGE
jgi:signal transduction histidine kinase